MRGALTRFGLIALLAGVLQVLAVAPAGAAVPYGDVEFVSSDIPGQVYVRGLAYDDDDVSASVGIEIYIGPSYGNYLGLAQAHRPDGNEANPNHGFEAIFNVPVVGDLDWQVVTIDPQDGSRSVLETGRVTIADPTPSGFVAGVTSPSHRTVALSGWASDPNAPTAPVPIEVYVGGSFSTPGVEYHPLTADIARSDGKPGFSGQFVTAKTGSQDIYVYAQNIPGTPGTARLLGIYPVTINIDTKPPVTKIDSAPTVATPRDVITITFSSDEPGSTFECRWDTESFAPCTTPTTTSLPTGQHTIQVRATDKAGNADPIPATAVVVVSNDATQPLPGADRAIKIRAVKKKSKLRIDVAPDSATDNYRITIQRKTGKKWVTVKKTRTRGAKDTIVLNLPRGKYRAILPKTNLIPAVTSTAVRLKR